MPSVFSLPFYLPEDFILFSGAESSFTEGGLKVFIGRPFAVNYRYSEGLDTPTLSANIPPDDDAWYTRWAEVVCRIPPGEVLFLSWFEFHVPEGGDPDLIHTMYPSPNYPGYWECEEYTGLYARELVWYDDYEVEEQVVFLLMTEEEEAHLAERVEYNLTHQPLY